MIVNEGLLIFVASGAMILIVIVLLAPYLRRRGEVDAYDALTGQRYISDDSGDDDSRSERLDLAPRGVESDMMNRLSGRRSKKRYAPTIDERMFHAGLFTPEKRSDFRRLQVILPCILGVIGLAVGLTTGDSTLSMLVCLIGIVLGTYVPLNLLDRWERARKEETSFFLPLVIEQIAIGVSSSLDIGPCIARVVQMADERDSHNPVTELLRFVQAYVKSGASLADALNEVGRQCGNNDVKHSFRAMAQVSRYGGEISRQLQDLSDAVSTERATKIEEKIKKLELSATIPVALVLLAYMGILLLGIGATVVRGLAK